MAQVKRSNGTRRLSGNRAARYKMYRATEPWKKRKVRNLMRVNKLTRAQAERVVYDKAQCPKVRVVAVARSESETPEDQSLFLIKKEKGL